MRRNGLRRTSQSSGVNSEAARSIGIAPFNPRRRMWSGWRHILRIWLAEAPHSPRGFHALLKCCEATIRPAVVIAAVNRAPRIILGLGACFRTDHTDANSQHEQQEPHSRLLEWSPQL